ncbi:MAG: LOG family protein, partial [Deltaproteobacteria bacterium]
MTTKAPKAYNNRDFLNSRDARTVRILCEYLEPEKRLDECDVSNTVVFFGSARSGPDGTTGERMHKYYWAAEELAFRLASWSKTLTRKEHAFHVCTGGGPGVMEAANRGARRAGADTIGYNISLPFEQFPNEYITESLNFEFHYFFMRKLWFLYHAKAIIVFPGGFGTFDELFEVLTLKQTKKLEKTEIPILLYDEG